MPFGTIRIKLRPIKLAFLVDPKDKAALWEAIEINTFLWGGMFNPIIPVFKRIPPIWQNPPFKNLNNRGGKNIISGYLDAFDPDYVVPLGKCSHLTFEVGNRQIINSLEILTGVEENGTPKYGIGLFEILRHFINRELKFVRRKELDIYLIDFSRPFRLFLASVFGILPQDINKIFYERFSSFLGAKKISCSISNYSEFLTPEKFFLRRISSLYVKSIPIQAWRRDPCIFLLDATHPLDIIDYWNLRAVGWNIIPIPKQAVEFENTRKLALDFIEKNYFPYKSNPKIYHNTTLLKSRSIPREEIEEFTNSLKIPLPGKKDEPKFVFQHWYPRIWDEWARDKDGVECCELEARVTQYYISEYQKKITFRTLGPEFMQRFGGHGKPRFANEVDLRLYGGDEILAEVIPEGDINLIRAIGGIGFGEWRFSKRGMVYLSEYPDWSVHLSVPKAENVFMEWLKSKQLIIEISEPGHICKQMIKQLGGIWGISTLANEGIIKLLEKMSEGKSIEKEAFWGEISKIADLERFVKDRDMILKRLIDAQMFRLGIELQCPICRQHSWYSIKDADYQLQCPKCLERFLIPAHSPKEIKWSYRTFGPFSLSRQAYGVYSVLLTLRFFSQLLHGKTTPIMSFKVKKEKNEKEVEVDLGLLFQQLEFGYAKSELIFAECKTYNTFEKNDTDRMVFLADQFPGAFLVFATLRKSLTEKEKRLLHPVVNRGRRYWKAGRPFNGVLILTGTELFSDLGPPNCWKEAGGKHARFAEEYGLQRDLFRLCDITQQLYLDMKPWYQWLEDYWRKHRHRRKLVVKPETTWEESIKEESI